MAKVPLSQSNDGTVASTGIATVSLGPMTAFESWEVNRITVASASSVLVPTARVYRGAVAESRLIDGTYTGTLDTTDVALSLRAGDKVVAQWTGADVGSRCTLTLEGERVRP